MKKTKKIIFSSVLAVILVVVSVLLCLQALSFSDANALTKGLYNGSFTAFAETGETQTDTEIAETRYLISVNEDYLLLATALHIENVQEYTEVGYYITEEGDPVDADLSSNLYYTGITLQTATGEKTLRMEDIFTEDTKVMGMIVAEIKYNPDCQYAVQPYVVKEGVDQPILGTKYTVAAYGYIGYNFMSFNIRTIASADTGVRHWDSRKAAVVDFINKSGADVIGLQEVKVAQSEDLNAMLADNYEILYFNRGDGEGLACIYDRTVFKLISSEYYWLSETPDKKSLGWEETYYRIAAVLLLEHRETGEYVKMVNTHGPLHDATNTKAYELIMERSVSDDYFTFLCGDFNAPPETLGYVPVATELQDCRITAAQSSNRDHNTYTGWDSDEGTHLIDYCFVSKGENVEVLTYAVRTDKWGDNNQNYYSDHYAVQTTVRVQYKKDISVKFPITTQNGFDGKLDLT